MQFNTSCFVTDNPESWLILSIYIGFWGYSYYSLVIFLIHTHRRHRLQENMDLEEKGLSAGD
ncbi:MAG: hypothetical protein QNJ72_31050 [Pleurocapsa sp. MO_226.B13]|nr:hypothetical protein [Pleurocapsa sp. MO_226.B13]